MKLRRMTAFLLSCAICVTALFSNVAVHAEEAVDLEVIAEQLAEMDGIDLEDVQEVENADQYREVVEAVRAEVQKERGTTGASAEFKVAEEDEEEISAAAVSFADVPYNAWYYNAVSYVASYGIMSGYTNNGCFGPTDNLTRGQFATILYRISGQPPVNFQYIFPDVMAGQYYSLPAIWANANGIITGYSNSGKFGPNDYITREQIATILYRFSQKIGKNVSLKANLSTYPDQEYVNSYAREAMSYAVGSSLMKGNNGYLRPQNNAMRAEIANILMTYLSQEPVAFDPQQYYINNIINAIYSSGETDSTGTRCISTSFNTGGVEYYVDATYDPDYETIDFYCAYTPGDYVVVIMFFYDINTRSALYDTVFVDFMADGLEFSAKSPDFYIEDYPDPYFYLAFTYESNVSLNQDTVQDICEQSVYACCLAVDILLSEYGLGTLHNLGFVSLDYY